MAILDSSRTLVGRFAGDGIELYQGETIIRNGFVTEDNDTEDPIPLAATDPVQVESQVWMTDVTVTSTSLITRNSTVMSPQPTVDIDVAIVSGPDGTFTLTITDILDNLVIPPNLNTQVPVIEVFLIFSQADGQKRKERFVILVRRAL